MRELLTLRNDADIVGESLNVSGYSIVNSTIGASSYSQLTKIASNYDKDVMVLMHLPFKEAVSEEYERNYQELNELYESVVISKIIDYHIEYDRWLVYLRKGKPLYGFDIELNLNGDIISKEVLKHPLFRITDEHTLSHHTYVIMLDMDEIDSFNTYVKDHGYKAYISNIIMNPYKYISNSRIYFNQGDTSEILLGHRIKRFKLHKFKLKDDIYSDLKVDTTKVMQSMVSKHYGISGDKAEQILHDKKVVVYNNTEFVKFDFRLKEGNAMAFKTMMNAIEDNIIPIRFNWEKVNRNLVTGGVVLCDTGKFNRIYNKIKLFGLDDIHVTYYGRY